DDEEGLMKRGTIVRHLTLPGCMEDSQNVIRYLYETYGDRIYISIMNQYTPLAHVKEYPELNRKITAEEYDELVKVVVVKWYRRECRVVEPEHAKIFDEVAALFYFFFVHKRAPFRLSLL
ncbi:MAG: hypothetical protein ACI4OA_01905, partial [Selenomonadaceae bacterium]